MLNDQIEEEKRDADVRPVFTENRRNEGEESKMNDGQDAADNNEQSE